MKLPRWSVHERRRERAAAELAAAAEMFRAEPARRFYGLDLVHVAGVRTFRVYPILAELERDGVVASGWEPARPDGRSSRRQYWAAV